MELVLDISIEFEDELPENNGQYLNKKYSELTDKDQLEDYIKKLIQDEYEPEKPVYISLYLTTNEIIKEINRDYRGKDSATDVISFAYHETEGFDVGPYDTLGDIVISLERVEEQSLDYGHSLKREFYYVLTHGILHLLGYDHIEESDKKEMREREEEILKKFGYVRD